MNDADGIETFFIIACADKNGAEAMTKRLRKDLQNSNAQPSISMTTLVLTVNEQPWDKQISEVTAQLGRLIQANLLEKENLR
jgi:hypothetical protein